MLLVYAAKHNYSKHIKLGKVVNVSPLVVDIVQMFYGEIEVKII